jgi:flavin reductase (DIM6/NTAB) family NADH-FMN oxidoreductase RutF
MQVKAMAQQQTHSVISPAILYWGTPVVLITSSNEDGTSNISPMSSAFWLGHSCVLGLDASSKTTENMLRTKQCVLNLADDSMTPFVNKLACTTGSDPVSESKKSRNYLSVKDKWTRAGLHPQPSDFVAPQRIMECPVQMECQVVNTTQMFNNMPDRKGLIVSIEVRVLRVHVIEELRMQGRPNRIDPDKWRPLIMSFQHFYGLRQGKVDVSVLAGVEEEKYRGLTTSEVVKQPGDDDEDMVASTR